MIWGRFIQDCWEVVSQLFRIRDVSLPHMSGTIYVFVGSIEWKYGLSVPGVGRS